jgi:hypothetical protein
MLGDSHFMHELTTRIGDGLVVSAFVFAVAE